MRKELSKEDAWLAYEFAMLLDYASNADQSDDEKQIKLVRLGERNKSKNDAEDARRENFNRVAVGLEKGFTCYDDMPFGTKSFISHCAVIAKKNKKSNPPKSASFLQIVKEEYKREFGEYEQADFFH